MIRLSIVRNIIGKLITYLLNILYYLHFITELKIFILECNLIKYSNVMELNFLSILSNMTPTYQAFKDTFWIKILKCGILTFMFNFLFIINLVNNSILVEYIIVNFNSHSHIAHRRSDPFIPEFSTWQDKRIRGKLSRWNHVYTGGYRGPDCAVRLRGYLPLMLVSTLLLITDSTVKTKGSHQLGLNSRPNNYEQFDST